jgi:hypothetical protein
MADDVVAQRHELQKAVAGEVSALVALAAHFVWA